jgi:hypothetical protein
MGASCANGLVADGATGGFNSRQSSGKFRIYKGITQAGLNAMDVGVTGGLAEITHGGPYPDAHTILAVVINGQTLLVDWTAVTAKYNGTTPSTDTQAKVGDGLKSVRMVLSALNSSLSAVGDVFPPVAVVSSFVEFFLGSLLDDAEDQPKQITIEEIRDTLVEVIEEANDKDRAREAASVFFDTLQWLADQAARAVELRNSTVNGRTDPNVLRGLDAELQDEIKSRASETSNVSEQLSFCRSNPSITMWILPAYIAGVTAKLQLHRLDDIRRAVKGAPITDVDVNVFLRDVNASIEGLKRGRDRLDHYADTKCAEEKVPPTTVEGQTLRKWIFERHTGTGSLAFVDEAVVELEAIRNSIQAEIQALKTPGSSRQPTYAKARKRS